MLDKAFQLHSRRIACQLRCGNWRYKVKPRGDGQIQFSSEFMAKLPLTSRKARFGLIQLFQFAFGFVGRGVAAFLVSYSPKQEENAQEG